MHKRQIFAPGQKWAFQIPLAFGDKEKLLSSDSASAKH